MGHVDKKRGRGARCCSAARKMANGMCFLRVNVIPNCQLVLETMRVVTKDVKRNLVRVPSVGE